MTAIYRRHEIRITQMPNGTYFIVLDPSGAKMTSGFFSLNDSLVQKYSDLRNRIDMEIDQ